MTGTRARSPRHVAVSTGRGHHQFERHCTELVAKDERQVAERRNRAAMKTGRAPLLSLLVQQYRSPMTLSRRAFADRLPDVDTDCITTLLASQRRIPPPADNTWT